MVGCFGLWYFIKLLLINRRWFDQILFADAQVAMVLIKSDLQIKFCLHFSYRIRGQVIKVCGNVDTYKIKVFTGFTEKETLHAILMV